MKLTTLLASSAALAAIAIAVPATIAPNWSPVATAQAATSISFSASTVCAPGICSGTGTMGFAWTAKIEPKKKLWLV